MSGPGSIQAQLNALRAKLETEAAYVVDLECRLAEAESRLRLATGLLRDTNRSAGAIVKFLDEVP